MLAHHPETGAPIRILKTAPTLYSDGKTLVWLRAGFEPSARWGRWGVVISEAAAVDVCGSAAVSAVVLGAAATPADWRSVWSTLFNDSTETLFFAPADIVTAFDAAGLQSPRTFVTEDLYDSYPYLGEPLKATDPLEKTIVSVAHLLRYNRIAWTAGADREAFSFGVRAQLDAWWRCISKGGSFGLLGLSTDATDAVVPRTWLIQQYYVDTNHRRAREIQTCLERNLACDYIDHVLLLNEADYKLPASSKLQTRLLGHRLRYYDVFVAARECVPAGDYVIFANSDIYFNDTLAHLWKIQLTTQRLFLALLRWEREANEPPTIFGPRADSQDAWILARDCIDFVPHEDDLGFPFGKPGCDNAIALIMMRHKFLIANPAYSIKTIHLHSSQIRRYNPRDVLYRSHFLYVEPSAIQGCGVVADMSGRDYKVPPAVGIAWNAARLGRSFPRPILCEGDAATVCSMLRREGWTYAPNDANLWTPPPSAAPLYSIRGGSFVSNEGLVCDFRQIYTGGHAEWVSAWEGAAQSALMPCVHVPHLVAVPFKPEWSKSLGKWALNYLPRALAVREAVRGVTAAPEFLVPQVDSIGAFLADCKWSGADERGNITVVPYLEDSNYYAEHVWAVPPTGAAADLVTAEDVGLLRGLLPVAPVCEYKPIVVFCVEDGEDTVCTRTWAESVADNLFHTGWTVRYVGGDTGPAARRRAFADASWIFGAGDGLDWIWMAGAGATVMEFVTDYEPRGDHIHLAGAAGLRYALGPVKREPLIYQRQHALLATAAAFQKHGLRELLALPSGTEATKPIVVLPTGGALTGIFEHAGDTFREMAEIWGERGYVKLERREDTPYCWWGGVGQVLLYDRPTPRWWPSAPPSYQMALFGNCSPPGPGPHSLKQSVWSFWGRRPRLLEGVARRVENMRGYESRPIASLFIGKIENGVQHAARTGADWSKAVELFSMPIDSTGKPYPYTAEQYLEKLCHSRFGLCLPGYGPKCNREIEYFCCGTVPIVTPGVDMKGYLVPPVEGTHYYCAATPEEVQRIIAETSPEKWAKMSAAGREWWRSNASADGFFRLTQARINQCRPYLTVGIPPNLKI